MRIAFVGTDLARLDPGSGALERAVIAWARGLRARGHEVSLLDAGPLGASTAALGSLGCDLTVLNNRPCWGGGIEAPTAVLQVLHNYEDAWSSRPVRPGAYEAALCRPESAVMAVSPSLARHVEATFATAGPVAVATVPIEQCFLAARWAGRGGPVLFPNRLLEKKGVRFFLELARRLAGRGLSCRLFAHTAPFDPPTSEQQELLSLAAASPHVELLAPPSSREEMAAAYAAAGAVCCPSVRPEGLGLVALEAQAVGAPLVTSGLGGLSDATFPPNEVVAGFHLDDWEAAVLRALQRGGSDQAAAAVAARHSEERATASIELAAERLDGTGGRRSAARSRRV